MLANVKMSLLFMQEPPKEDLTVSEKFQLVLDVAQKAQVEQIFSISLELSSHLLVFHKVFLFSFQNLFGKMADVLEKIKK